MGVRMLLLLLLLLHISGGNVHLHTSQRVRYRTFIATDLMRQKRGNLTVSEVQANRRLCATAWDRNYTSADPLGDSGARRTVADQENNVRDVSGQKE